MRFGNPLRKQAAPQNNFTWGVKAVLPNASEASSRANKVKEL